MNKSILTIGIFLILCSGLLGITRIVILSQLGINSSSDITGMVVSEMPADENLREKSYEMAGTVSVIEKLPIYMLAIGTIITAIGILAPDFR
ncbi:hypothetical protein COV14_05910 [Candidatus Woesearchaeota archaeon CG10_big_fil_rev_8_21_14_0_10_33_12]|nr:MAG: hypothetical protein COV14_05910 [Candidatus Woesearchaeota archaeon CG10_big_fil_rev_8_21_14_0_10_33_12]